jgi:hypothetical protein
MGQGDRGDQLGTDPPGAGGLAAETGDGLGIYARPSPE